MAVRVAISGFGRIGRLVARTIIESGRDDVEIVAVNNRGPVGNAAHLFKYDSVHGRFGFEVKGDEEAGTLDLGRGPVAYTRHTDPRNCEWEALDVDIVMECTGKFSDRDDAALHLAAGAKRVLVSAPSKGADRTIVFGVKDEMLQADDLVVSSASCTTNCLAPVASVLKEICGIEQGFMTTIHAYTGDQPTLDRNHKDLHRARSAAMSMVPTSTGAAKAVGLVLPELVGKLDGAAVRVPTPNVSLIDLVFTPGKATTAEELTEAVKAAADGPMKGVLGYDSIPLVSIDYNHDSRSSIVAIDKIKVIDERLARVMTWYDNEWGFACRMIDTTAAMGKFL